VTDADLLAGSDLAAVRDVAGRGISVFRCDPTGAVVERVAAP